MSAEQDVEAVERCRRPHARGTRVVAGAEELGAQGQWVSVARDGARLKHLKHAEEA